MYSPSSVKSIVESIIVMLTKQQEEEISKMSEYFKNVEKVTEPNNIYLDVFLTEYSDDGISLYSTERVMLNEKGKSRKEAFEKAEAKKQKAMKANS